MKHGKSRVGKHTEMKNSLENLRNTFELTEERISELKGRSTEIIHLRNRKRERGKINRVSKTCGKPTYTYIYIMRVP